MPAEPVQLVLPTIRCGVSLMSTEYSQVRRDVTDGFHWCGGVPGRCSSILCVCVCFLFFVFLCAKRQNSVVNS